METPMDCEDLKEFEMSRLISFSNDIVPSVMPFIHKSVQNYGKFGGKKNTSNLFKLFHKLHYIQ